MVRFYDTLDKTELKRIEQVLHSGGIEYFLRETPELGFQGCEILIAEEDLPQAEQLLVRSRH